MKNNEKKNVRPVSASRVPVSSVTNVQKGTETTEYTFVLVYWSRPHVAPDDITLSLPSPPFCQFSHNHPSIGASQKGQVSPSRFAGHYAPPRRPKGAVDTPQLVENNNSNSDGNNSERGEERALVRWLWPWQRHDQCVCAPDDFYHGEGKGHQQQGTTVDEDERRALAFYSSPSAFSDQHYQPICMAQCQLLGTAVVNASPPPHIQEDWAYLCAIGTLVFLTCAVLWRKRRLCWGQAGSPGEAGARHLPLAQDPAAPVLPGEYVLKCRPIIPKFRTAPVMVSHETVLAFRTSEHAFNHSQEVAVRATSKRCLPKVLYLVLYAMVVFWGPSHVTGERSCCSGHGAS